MANFFNSVRITNFKSLKDVTLSDCKRINLLIGKPNVGKSNILEAIGLLGLNYSHFNKNKKLSQFIRFDNVRELFFDGKTDEAISITINNVRSPSCVVNHQKIEDAFQFFDKQLVISLYFDSEVNKHAKAFSQLTVDNDLNIALQHTEHGAFHNIKQYRFSHNPDLEKVNIPYLLPPFGVNLLNVIQEHKILKKELLSIFGEYGLKLAFDNANHSLKIMKEMKDGEIFLLPYNSIADTLQRIIFYKAAISSNQDSILLFEEPEAHCFPPYIAHFTQDVIEAESNQFFIATHSPYVLNDFLEYAETRAQLAIYMADFKDGQTVVYRLTDEELDEVYNYGLDVFFNYERFTEHG